MRFFLLLWALSQREPGPGCQWAEWKDEQLGLTMKVQKCEGSSARELKVVNSTVRLVKPGSSPNQGPVVLEIYEKGERQKMKDAIDRRFLANLTARQKAGCEPVPADETVQPGGGKQAWQIVPNAIYRAEAERLRESEPGAEVCGSYGVSDSLQYFEYHPSETKFRFLFIRAALAGGMIDLSSIRLADIEP